MSIEGSLIVAIVVAIDEAVSANIFLDDRYVSIRSNIWTVKAVIADNPDLVVTSLLDHTESSLGRGCPKHSGVIFIQFLALSIEFSHVTSLVVVNSITASPVGSGSL